jgi:PEP-CTERM motif
LREIMRHSLNNILIKFEVTPVKTSIKILLAAAFIAPAAMAHATSLTFTGYGVALPPGETLVTDFSTLPGTFTGTGTLVTGSSSGVYAAPAFSATTFDTSQYLAVEGGQSETFTPTAPIHDLSIYLGSLDSYNSISVTSGATTVTYTGAEIASLTGAVDNGNQTSASSNGRLTLVFSSPVSSVTFASSANSFEIASVATSAVPEPAAWSLMLVGLGAMGAVLRRRRSPRLAHI